LNLENVDGPDLEKFGEELRYFFEGPGGGDTEVLRELVVKFAGNDKRLKEGMALVKHNSAT